MPQQERGFLHFPHNDGHHLWRQMWAIVTVNHPEVYIHIVQCLWMPMLRMSWEKKNTVVSVQHHVTMYQKLQLTSAGLVQDKNEQERHSRQEEGNGHHQQCIPRQRCKHLAVGTKMNMYRPCMLSDNKKYINYAYTIIYVYMYGDMYTSSNCFINLHK